MKGTNELVLYLDFDGVLHHENCLWHPKLGDYVWSKYWDEPVAHENDLSLTGLATNMFAEPVAAVVLK